jgi:hypothetical protein
VSVWKHKTLNLCVGQNWKVTPSFLGVNLTPFPILLLSLLSWPPLLPLPLLLLPELLLPPLALGSMALFL